MNMLLTNSNINHRSIRPIRKLEEGIEVVLLWRDEDNAIVVSSKQQGFPILDTHLSKQATYYYRIISRNKLSGSSTFSSVIQAKPLDEYHPSPPQWNQPEFNSEGLLLSWESIPVLCLIQRKNVASSEWNSISGWLSREQHSYLDNSREYGQVYQYRMVIMDDNKRTNASFLIITV